MKGYHAVETDVCGNCKHFHQHYVKWGKGFRKLHYGHCIHPRMKNRRTDETCPHFAPATNDAP